MSAAAGPDLIQNGLVLCLDAANPRSYSGSGTTWRDLSGNNNNGTLSNMDNTNFSSNNGGSFIFDGSTERVNCGNPSSLQITVGTISAWFNATNTNSGYNGIIAKQFAWGLFVRDNILVSYSWGSSGGEKSTGLTVGNNTWNYVAMTFSETLGTPLNNAIIYLNSRLVLTTTIGHANHTVDVHIGDANASQFFSGNIAQASIYNRVLNATEIFQNYNALKGRFLLT